MESSESFKAKKKAWIEARESFIDDIKQQVIKLCEEQKMEVDVEIRKRTCEQFQQPSEEEGLLSNVQFTKKVRPLSDDDFADKLKASKYYQDEDTGFLIPRVHPYYNLPHDLQMLILDVPADKIDGILDYIENHFPRFEDMELDEEY
jgi:hypothetical protein